MNIEERIDLDFKPPRKDEPIAETVQTTRVYPAFNPKHEPEVATVGDLATEIERARQTGEPWKFPIECDGLTTYASEGESLEEYLRRRKRKWREAS